jgi:preprotein translocase subunit SecG
MVAYFIAFQFIVTGEWAASIVGGVVGGLVSAVLMWWFVNRFWPSGAEFAGLTRDQQRAAKRGAIRGPVPADPIVRDAAFRVAVANRNLMRRIWWFSTTTFLVLLAVCAIAAIIWSGWWWLAFAWFVAILILQFGSRRRADRRIKMLSNDTLAD